VPLGEDAPAKHFVHALAKSRVRHAFQLFAWVVMPEHVHLIIRPAIEQTWATIASSIKNPVARASLPRVTDRPARFWQRGGGFDRHVRDLTEFSEIVRYIHRNPVERGLVAKPEDWAFSSVRWWMGRRENEVECDSPPGRGWDKWTGYM